MTPKLYSGQEVVDAFRKTLNNDPGPDDNGDDSWASGFLHYMMQSLRANHGKAEADYRLMYPGDCSCIWCRIQRAEHT